MRFNCSAGTSHRTSSIYVTASHYRSDDVVITKSQLLAFSVGIYTTPLSGDVTHQRVNSAAIYEAIAVVASVRQRRADGVTRRGVE